jgi:hypothetical protein
VTEVNFGSYTTTYRRNLVNLNFLLKMEAGGSAEALAPSNGLRHMEDYHNFELTPPTFQCICKR